MIEFGTLAKIWFFVQIEKKCIRKVIFLFRRLRLHCATHSLASRPNDTPPLCNSAVFSCSAAFSSFRNHNILAVSDWIRSNILRYFVPAFTVFFLFRIFFKNLLTNVFLIIGHREQFGSDVSSLQQNQRELAQLSKTIWNRENVRSSSNSCSKPIICSFDLLHSVVSRVFSNLAPLRTTGYKNEMQPTESSKFQINWFIKMLISYCPGFFFCSKPKP